MRRLKPLLLVLLTFSLLSCETTRKPASTTSGLGKTSQCGEILVGVTTEKPELELAGATLKEFSLGKLDVKVTPQFQRITSEAAMNEDSKIKVACKAIEMAGVEGKPEMVAYFIQLQSFLSTNQTLDDRIKWAQAFPIPSAPKPKETSQNKAAVRQLVEDGYALKASIEGDYFSHRKQNTFAANQADLLKAWRARVFAWEDSVAATLQQIEPIVRAQFQNYRGGSGPPRWGENALWAELDGELNGKLNFLIQVMNRL
jgi:hypothetical protein